MISIVHFSGGLGNQMFIFSFTLSLREKYPFSKISIDIKDCTKTHNGFELPIVFNIGKEFRIDQNKVINLFLNRHTKKRIFHWFNEKNAFIYDEKIMEKYCLFSAYNGFWQSEKYFTNIENKIRRTFKFNHESLNYMSYNLLKTVSTQDSVSVHIRRGDYLGIENTKVVTTTYYLNAINYVKSKIASPSFYFFSDDIEWVKSNFSLNNAIYVDWNIGKDSWQDMCLMSNCKHNIIANSTFSWWGAWLNENPGKIVIAPKKWMADLDESDIIPNVWIKV